MDRMSVLMKMIGLKKLIGMGCIEDGTVLDYDGLRNLKAHASAISPMEGIGGVLVTDGRDGRIYAVVGRLASAFAPTEA